MINYNHFINTIYMGLKEDYETKLGEYTTAQQLLVAHRLQQKPSSVIANDPNLNKYIGRNIKVGSDYYFVNEFGMYQRYDDDAWENKSWNCKQGGKSPEVLNRIPADFHRGNDIDGTRCRNTAGRIIYKTELNDNKEKVTKRAWVSASGNARLFDDDDVWNNRSSSCRKAPTSKIDPLIFDNMINNGGTPMTKDTECDQNTWKYRNDELRLKADVQRIGVELNRLVNNMSDDMKETIGFNDTLTTAIDVDETDIYNDVKIIDGKVAERVNYIPENITLNAGVESSREVFGESKSTLLLGYLVLVILMIVLFYINGIETMEGITIIIIIAFSMLYFLYDVV